MILYFQLLLPFTLELILLSGRKKKRREDGGEIEMWKRTGDYWLQEVKNEIPFRVRVCYTLS